jgi:DNA-directed RNA polymerase specialized sigma subunit
MSGDDGDDGDDDCLDRRVVDEAAVVLGVTESRVCQLHREPILRLRTKLREW